MAARADEEAVFSGPGRQNPLAESAFQGQGEDARTWLAAIVESSEDAIVSKTLDGTILSWNAGAERLFGYTQKEIVGRPITTIIPQELWEEERLILARLRCGERIEQFETVRVSKTGRRLEISLTVSPVRNVEGQVIGAAKVARDITARKRAEAALRESESRLRFLADLALVIQPLREPTAVMTAAARMLAEQLGVDRCAYAELEDESVFVITGDYPIGVPSIVGRWPVAAFGAECVRCMREKMPFVVCDIDAEPQLGADERRTYRATTIQAVICVPLHKDDKFIAALAVHNSAARQWTAAEVQLVRTVGDRCWETLERLRVTRSLEESRASYRQAARTAAQAASANAKFRAFFEQGTNFAGVLSLDGTVIEANRFCLEVCGFTREESIGRPFWECGWWNRSAALMAVIRGASAQAASGQQFRTETPYFVADGSERIMDLIMAPVIDPTGRVLFVAATGSDMTQRRQMEDSLRASDRKKDEFIALLAHELRNPLAPIRNGLQVLRLAGDDIKTAERALLMMERQLSHMVRLIDELLDISRINRRKMELRRARVTLGEVISSAIETARPLIDAEGHTLTVVLPPSPVYLDADLTRLAQVFSNLLTNSAKYTKPGGHIWLTAVPQSGEVAVSVQDTGIGIPAESLGTIFDMFAQLDRSIERATGGLGIGLALVKGLVEMHGGTVTAQSGGAGQGSTFTVTLPVIHPEEPAAAPPAENLHAAAGPQRRILVVDDNHDGAESLAMMLELLNNDVQIAHDGVEAVHQAELFRPHLILMDIGMPRLNGYEATRRIRQEPWGRNITIIALTGWGQEVDRARSQEAGCNGHLVKPMNRADLQKLLEQNF